MKSYKAQVKLQKVDSTLNVRNEPSKNGDRIGRIGHGAIVTVQAEYENGWKFISYGNNSSGYVDGSFLIPYEEPEVEEPTLEIQVDGESIVAQDEDPDKVFDINLIREIAEDDTSDRYEDDEDIDEDDEDHEDLEDEEDDGDEPPTPRFKFNFADLKFGKNYKNND